MFSIATIKELAHQNHWADADSHCCLSVDLRGAELTHREAVKLDDWLKIQSVPVVGVVDDDCRLIDGLDILVGDENELAKLEGYIAENPVAATVLVQTTRLTAALPTHSALIAESLAYGMLQGGIEHQAWLSHQAKPQTIQPESSEEPIRLERSDGRLEITLAQPENRNALSADMRDALSQAFQLVAADSSIQQVIVSGEGPCFSAGGDLTEFGSIGDGAEAHRIRQLRMPAGFLVDQSSRYTFRLHGACIGAGIELPAFGKHLIAEAGTWFRLPEVSMGLIPGAGGCVSIPRRIGRHRTNYMAITGQAVSAESALAWGLIDELLPESR